MTKYVNPTDVKKGLEMLGMESRGGRPMIIPPTTTGWEEMNGKVMVDGKDDEKEEV